MNIKGNYVTLRAVEEEDLELLREMINDPEIEKMVGGYSFPVSKVQQKGWFESISDNKNDIRLIIETKEDGAIGFANIVNIDWKNRSAFHGIKIANKNFRRKGIGTDAVMAVMKYAFEELHLNRLDSSIIDYNEPSKKLYCKCGWKVEGIRREAIFKGNQYHDELVVGILKEEYEELIRKNNYWKR
ncbi:N-acetyltransferase [Acidilutibacter cellobiosedens]|uniref:N-acetyltransferase n=1 Tax=Acidilutibacter cellobiosedens TaxID=2507161 RepID=A0A410QDB8_9FIRM|nr:GNAT family protein [Acidilutibacter cellobiosedens]QAT62013.1 N-acetyltransferase [Acidilutibacter cellobiosedens]